MICNCIFRGRNCRSAGGAVAPIEGIIDQIIGRAARVDKCRVGVVDSDLAGLRKVAKQVFVVGNAVEPHDVIYAMLEGARAGLF